MIIVFFKQYSVYVDTLEALNQVVLNHIRYNNLSNYINFVWKKCGIKLTNLAS